MRVACLAAGFALQPLMVATTLGVRGLLLAPVLLSWPWVAAAYARGWWRNAGAALLAALLLAGTVGAATSESPGDALAWASVGFNQYLVGAVLLVAVLVDRLRGPRAPRGPRAAAPPAGRHRRDRTRSNRSAPPGPLR